MDSAGPEEGPTVGFCEHGDEILSTINTMNFLISSVTVYVPRQALLRRQK
jgi:hypothetical protein